MPALVKALNRVDLPTLGKPTIPHFMKVLMNQYPACTIEPNVGIVEEPAARQFARSKRSKPNPSKQRIPAKFCPRLALEV
jgi:ribosome-binding ATPase YchF (GTP1/OBG family)